MLNALITQLNDRSVNATENQMIVIILPLVRGGAAICHLSACRLRPSVSRSIDASVIGTLCATARVHLTE